MKLIDAIRKIEELERLEKKAKKETKRQTMPFRNQFVNMQNTSQKKLVNVQSIFPKDDVLLLKIKTKQPHIKEALSKAIYFYLKNADEN